MTANGDVLWELRHLVEFAPSDWVKGTATRAIDCIEEASGLMAEANISLRQATTTMDMARERIEVLEAALRRIDAINDNPACFHKDIDDVIRIAFAPESSSP